MFLGLMRMGEEEKTCLRSTMGDLGFVHRRDLGATSWEWGQALS